MANVIIAVHGLGNKPPKQLLEDWWKLSIVEGLNASNFKTDLPEFEMVYWADIIHKRSLDEAENNIDSPYYMDEKYTSSPENFHIEDRTTHQKVVDFIGRQLNRIFLNEDLTLNYSAIADAIVSKYFKELEIYYSENYIGENNDEFLARNLIRERLLITLERHKNDKIMIISHSMGSIVAFDVLTFLVPHIKVDTFVTIGSPLGLPIVITKIASEQKKRHIEVNQLSTPNGILKHWFNFSDILDKVALDYKLADNFFENDHGIKPVDFLVVNDYMMNGVPNPHKSYGYLRTPEFSKIMNDFILSEKLTLREKIINISRKVIDRVKTYISPKKRMNQDE